MELRQLEYFQMVSRLRHVSHAAEQLHVSQPSVTVAVKKLEEELGVQLLDRSGKRISLTPEGQAFLVRCDDILGRVRDTVAEMSDYQRLQKGTVRIAITPIMGAVLFPFAFAHFQKRFPAITITVTEEGSLSIRQRLEKGELDVGILITSSLSPRLKTVPITTGQVTVCLPPSHPLAGRHRIPFPELRDQPFILFREDTYSRQIILEECQRCGFSPRIVFSSNQIATIMELVKRGVGISFFIEEIACRQEGIISRPLADPLRLEAGLAWNGGRYLPKAAEAFIHIFRETLPEAGALQQASPGGQGLWSPGAWRRAFSGSAREGAAGPRRRPGGTGRRARPLRRGMAGRRGGWHVPAGAEGVLQPPRLRRLAISRNV